MIRSRRVHDDVLALAVLVPGNNVLLPHFTVNEAVFLVLDAAVALVVELVEVDFSTAAFRRGKRFDGESD
jgi:hypothetical protein